MSITGKMNPWVSVLKGKIKKSAFCEMGENKSKLQSDIGDENLKNTLNKSIYLRIYFIF